MANLIGLMGVIVYCIFGKFTGAVGIYSKEINGKHGKSIFAKQGKECLIPSHPPIGQKILYVNRVD